MYPKLLENQDKFINDFNKVQDEHIALLREASERKPKRSYLTDFELDNTIGGYLDYFSTLTNAFLSDT